MHCFPVTDSDVTMPEPTGHRKCRVVGLEAGDPEPTADQKDILKKRAQYEKQYAYNIKHLAKDQRLFIVYFSTDIFNARLSDLKA